MRHFWKGGMWGLVGWGAGGAWVRASPPTADAALSLGINCVWPGGGLEALTAALVVNSTLRHLRSVLHPNGLPGSQ